MDKNTINGIIKSCCDMLRGDDGINGNYIEALSWILYLKFLDNFEQEQHERSKISKKSYKYILQKKFRWSEWLNSKKLTGINLTKFINKELFPYLRNLENEGGVPLKRTVSNIFKSCDNNVKSGYILAKVFEKINTIQFENKEVFVLSEIYELALRDFAKDGGRNSGEYYTPRPLIKTIVHLLKPKLEEKIYDPACGTGGFLAEAHNYLQEKVKTVSDRKLLKKQFYGQEKN